MFKTIFLFLICTSLYAISPGENAPDFKLMGSDGKSWKLNELKGKTVVLEWFNHGCPYVRKHYDVNNMQALQKKFKNKVVWLTINSSAPNKQGHLASAKLAKQKYQEEKMSSHAILLDGISGSTIGRLFKAKTTPHMFVIDKMGKVAYNGAIDSTKSADSADIASSTPLFANALNAVLAGMKAPKAKNKPYGCSVKY